MAINTQKFLPSKKYELGNYLGGNNVGTKNLKSRGGARGESSQLLEIKNKIIQVEKLISSTTLLKSYEAKQKRKDAETKKRTKRESDLEKNDTDKEAIKTPDIPGLGFLDRVKKFFLSILFGFIAYRLVDYLPKLVKFVSIATPAFKFLETFTGSLFGSLVNLIDKGYQFVDKTEKLIKDFGGEEAAKNFNKFEGILVGFINSALLFKMLLAKTPRGAAGSLGASVVVGRGYGYTPEPLPSGVKPGTTEGRAILKPQRQATRAAEKASRRVTAAAIRRGIAGETVEKAATQVATQGGKQSLKTLVAVPVIGSLIGFIIDTVVFREKPSRAAAGAIGSALGQGIGIALAGGTTFGLGAGVGMFVGGFVGDWIGKALYDGLVSTTIKEYAGGGSVRRGKSPAPNRTIKPPKRSLKIQSSPIKPGVDIGGEKKINKVFPKSQTEKQVSPYDFMKKSSKIMSSTDAFGPLFDLQSKALLGQKPSSTDYRNAAQGLNAWMSNTFSEGIVRGGMAFANGGSVDASMMIDDDMTSWIEASLRRFISPKVDNVIKELMKSLMLQEMQPGMKEEAQPTMEGDVTGLQGSAKEYYDYLISRGVSPNHAMGLVLNIARESSFRPGVQIIDINGRPSGGLFQWNAGRFDNMVKAVPDWKTNWKGQIDYALAEPQGAASGSNYLATQFKSPMEAAIWWMEKWERVADPARDTVKMQKILDAWIAQGMKQGQGPPAMLGAAPGNLSAAQALASSMGLQVTSYIRPGDPGYHGKGRAMDFQTVGAPGNMGTPSQMAFAQSMVSRYGANLKQLIYTPLGYGIADGRKVGLDYWGDKTNQEHYHHVHVAFAKGGRVSKPTRALIGEKGPEFVFDADTTKGLDQMMPNLLENLNAAKNKSQLMSVLMSYTDYEDMGEQTITVELPPPQVVVQQVPVPMGGSISFSGGSDPFANLAAL